MWRVNGLTSACDYFHKLREIFLASSETVERQRDGLSFIFKNENLDLFEVWKRCRLMKRRVKSLS